MGSTTCGTPLAVAAVAAALLLIFAASTGSLSLLGSSDVATRSRSRLPRSSAAVSTGSSAPAPPLHFVGTRIPRYIHQLWATVPWWHANGTAAAAAAEELPSAVWSAFLAWQHHNPDAVHVVWTDVTMERLVAQRFPALLAVYRSMKMIQRADLFRYLVLLEFGGVYADADVRCILPVDRWLAAAAVAADTLHRRRAAAPAPAPVKSRRRLAAAALSAADTLLVRRHRRRGASSSSSAAGASGVGLIAAVEWGVAHAAQMPAQLLQFAMASAPNHAVLRIAINTVLRNWNMGGGFQGLGQKETVQLTGPGAWTRAFALHALCASPRCGDDWAFLARWHELHDLYAPLSTADCASEGFAPPRHATALEGGGWAAQLCSWRQTAGCAPTGPREAERDRGCFASIGAGASGYCACERAADAKGRLSLGTAAPYRRGEGGKTIGYSCSKSVARHACSTDCGIARPAAAAAGLHVVSPLRVLRGGGGAVPVEVPAEALAPPLLGSGRLMRSRSDGRSGDASLLAVRNRLRDELESVESELRLSGGATTGAGVDAIRVVARCGDVVVLSEPALHGVLAQHGADGAGLGSWKGTG